MVDSVCIAAVGRRFKNAGVGTGRASLEGGRGRGSLREGIGGCHGGKYAEAGAVSSISNTMMTTMKK